MQWGLVRWLDGKRLFLGNMRLSVWRFGELDRAMGMVGMKFDECHVPPILLGK